MANTPTANYSFLKPAKSDVGWWATLNANFDAIDSTIKAIQNQIDTTLHVGILHVFSSHILNQQGSWVAWNRTAGTGETNLVNHRGGGAGGFYFDTTSDAATFQRLAQIDTAFGDTQTSLAILRNLAGVPSFVRVAVGAVNSGGTGFRALTVPN